MIHTEPCPYCNSPVELVTGAVVYPHRSDLFAKQFWRCTQCNAYTGCHDGTTKRLGRLANAETRRLRLAAHSAFDPLWRNGKMSRSAAYRWLCKKLDVGQSDGHIGWLSDDQLKRLIELCRESV